MTVLSPHNGRPVRVRREDVGRAVRDHDGRVFYVLPRNDGQGYYASATRAGGTQAAEKYRELEARQPPPPEALPETSLEAGSAPAATAVHHAAGQRRSWRGRMVIFFFMLLVLGVLAAWWLSVGPGGHWPWRRPAAPPNPIRLDQPAQ